MVPWLFQQGSSPKIRSAGCHVGLFIGWLVSLLHVISTPCTSHGIVTPFARPV
jgi:hypothetical protein